MHPRMDLDTLAECARTRQPLPRPEPAPAAAATTPATLPEAISSTLDAAVNAVEVIVASLHAKLEQLRQEVQELRQEVIQMRQPCRAQPRTSSPVTLPPKETTVNYPELGELEDFDHSRAISLAEARKLLPGRKGSVSVEALRRWANPEKGCRPRGQDGPVLVFPTVRLENRLWTMPSWVAAFERRRVELGTAPRYNPFANERTPRSAAAAHRRAEATLDRAGIGVKKSS